MASAIGCLLVAGACSDPSQPAGLPSPPALVAPEPEPGPTSASAAAPPVVGPGPAVVVEPPTVVAPAPAPAAPAAVRLATPLAVSSGLVALVDESRPTVSGGEVLWTNRPLATWVWFPSSTAGGPWPLVVFAHGFEVGPGPYAPLCEAWAAAGYVVAAPEFPLTDVDVAGDYLDESDIDNQPDDVRFVIESLLGADSPLAGRIDPDRVAVAGHSDGGLTALAVAVEPLPGLRGVIALSTSPVYGGSVANPPILVVQGDDDYVNGFENGFAVYDQAAAPRYFLTLLGGDHLPPFVDGSPYLDAVDRVAVAFLDRYVAGRTSDDEALLAEADPDLTILDADP